MARFFQVLVRLGKAPNDVLRDFHRTRPDWLDALDLTTGEGVAFWLRELRGEIPILTLAERTGFTRFAVGRWLKGQTEPRLDQALTLIEACSLRVLDFVATMTDPSELPVAQDAWRNLQAARDAAHEAPWTQAVLRALELDAYMALPRHRDDWIAENLGIPPCEVTEALRLLEDTGQVKQCGKHMVPVQTISVDTRVDPAATRKQRSFWTGVAQARLVQGDPGTFSYNVFGISNEDLAR
jgi:hypothetical protein